MLKPLIPLLLLLSHVHTFTLNVPNVLLPLHIPQTMYTNFTLTADSGCFEWLSTKELVVSIQALQDDQSITGGCSRRAQLTSLSQDPDRQLSLILARETSTESELRVDVFVDTITKIAIRTTSLELLLEETPSTFGIVAYDDDGNTFSTLEGLEFEWTIEPDAEHQISGNVLQNILYADSSYLTPPTIGILESQGKQGDKILVQGINTGVAWVKARLAHPAYKGVAEVSVRVVVIENLLLNPPYDVWMLPLTQIRYKAERRQHGRKTEIQFPSDQYSLKLSNTTIGEISDDTTVTSLMLGDSDVILVDKNVQHLPLGTPPHTTIHVVPPSALLFKIESKNWNFETEKQYTFSISVLGPHNRPVLNTDNIRIKLTVDASHVTLLSSNKEGTQHTILAKDTGSTKILASLDTLIHPKTGAEHPVEPPVSSYQAVEVRSPISVTPTRVILPLYLIQPYTYRLLAEGGSGEYIWSSRDTTVVSVTKDGVVTGRTAGREVVLASDSKNADNSGSAEVIVAELSGLTFLPTKVETLVGDSLRLNLAAYLELEPGTKLPFTRCDLVPLVYSLSNDLFVMESEEKPGGELAQGVCSIITVTGVRPGSSLLKVTYTTSTGDVLSATVVIATYLPLSLTFPSHTPILTLGSSHLLTISGGPTPWVTDKSGYTEELKGVGDGFSAALVSRNKGAGGVVHSFRVTCLLLGEQTGMVIVGNKVTSDNRYPATESLTVRVKCEVPAVLLLSHSLPLPPSSCPLSDEVATLTERDLKLFFTVKTSDDKLFDNSSSLLFEFSSSDSKLSTVEQESLSGVENSRSSVVSHILNSVGTVLLSVTVKKYDEKYLTAYISSELQSGLAKSLSFKLVDELKISPSSLTMFNYEEGSREVEVKGGSGSFSTTVDTPGVLNMSAGDTSPILITPYLQGITTLTVQDLCLPEQTARCNVHVTGPAEVVIRSVSQLEIHNTALLTLSVIDSNNRKISSAVFPKLDLRHEISPEPHISIHPAEDQSSCDEFCTLYQVRGLSLGTSTVRFSVSGNTNVDSNLLTITVFPPLTLSPSPLVLVEGALFQLRYSGGPQHDSSLSFSSLNSTTATVNQRALVTGVTEGNVEVVGKCVGVRSDSDVVYSKAAVTVKVVSLNVIEIQAPCTYILEGSEIPLTVWGSDGLSPFTFASISGIVFSWTSSSESIHLNSLYHKSGYTVEDERQFVVSAKGLEQGVTSISVTATYTDSSGHVKSLTDSISIEVIRKVQLLSPSGPEFPDLLLGPGSTYNIRTNKDHSHTVHYSVLDGVDVLAISSDGTVSAEKLGTAAVKIDVLEDHNVNQTIFLNVQVKTPFALLLEESVAPSSKQQLEYPYHTLPMGLTTSFIVKTKDDLGRQFDSIPRSSYFYTLNRLDVVSVESVGSNSSLSLTGSSVGEAIVRVYTDTGLEGWGYVRVSSPLDVPVFTLLHLSTVCIPDLRGEDAGEWSSRDPTIATVSGSLVRGENLGVTELRKQITSTFSIIKVEVVKIESVTLSLSPNTPALSNLATSQTVSTLVLPVSIATTKPLSDLPATCGNQQGVKIKFQCVTSHPSIVTAAADLENRACVVTALPNTAVTSVFPLVSVQLDGAVSSSIKIPFVPRFKLAGDKATLSPENPTADISLLEGDISLVQVILDERAVEDLNIIKTSSNFHVSLLNWHTSTIHSISFICSLSGQQEVYEIVIEPSPPSPVPTTPIKLHFSDLLSTLLPTALLGLLVLLIVIGIVFLTTASYRRLQFASSPSNSSLLGKSDFPSPAKSIGSPFRPASLTATPTRLKTPLYTKPRGTPGSV